MTATARALVALVAAITLVLATSHTGANTLPPLRDHLLVSADWLANRLDDPNVLLLHVGHGPNVYTQRGHLPGAIFADVFEVLREDSTTPGRLPTRRQLIDFCRSVGITSDPGQRIVLYGESSGLLAARMYANLATVGLADRASLLDGHMRGWQGEGRPIETGGVTPTPSDFSPADDTTLGVTFDEVRDGQRDHAWQLIDARSVREFTGERQTRKTLAAGRIPSATSFPWQDTFKTVRRPVLLPPQTLREQAGPIDPTRPVVAYCASGVPSSMTFFILRYLGYDARWYGDSLIDWQQRGGPTATSIAATAE
ncbi:MAG: rhodanese-like domain-containing protein [Planctomycetota bacterium]